MDDFGHSWLFFFLILMLCCVALSCTACYIYFVDEARPPQLENREMALMEKKNKTKKDRKRMNVDEVESDSDLNDDDHFVDLNDFNSKGADIEGQVTQRTAVNMDDKQKAMELWIENKKRRDAKELRQWMKIIGYDMYFEIFTMNGLGRMDEVRRITDESKLEKIGILNAEDRMEIMAAIRALSY